MSENADVWSFRPPVLVGERVAWLGSGSGLPQGGIVRWIGKLPGMGPDWTIGMELDLPLPYGGIDGTWGNRQLFTCKPKHGLIVPVTKIVREAQLYTWPAPHAERKVNNDDLKQNVHSTSDVSAPTFPRRSRKVAKLTAPVRPIPRTSEDNEPAIQSTVAPQPVARRKKQRAPVIESSDCLIQKPIFSKRPAKQFTNIFPTLQEVKEPIYAIADPTQKILCAKESVSGDVKNSPNDSKVIKSKPRQEISDVKELTKNPGVNSTKNKHGYEEIKQRLIVNNEDVIENLSDEKKHSIKASDEKKSLSTNSETVVYFLPKPEKTIHETQSKVFLNSNTLKSFTSDDYSEYQWFDADDSKSSDFVDCTSSCYESLDCKSLPNVISEVINTKLSKNDTSFECDSKYDQVKIMNHMNSNNVCNTSDFSARENTQPITRISNSEELKVKSEHFPEIISPSGSTRKEKTSSGIFSFLRWFRRAKDGDDSEDGENHEFEEGLRFPTAPSTPELIHSPSSSCGSIDTLFSTATVTSFAFLTPTSYKSAQPEKRIWIGPETDTYKKRLHYRDKVREVDKNITLRRKYNLYGSDTILRSPHTSPLTEKKLQSSEKDEENVKNIANASKNRNCSFGRKKRKAPSPPCSLQFKGDSLPNRLDKTSKHRHSAMEDEASTSIVQPHHRRTYSESAKDRKSGAYCHVKGKRKAPQPPVTCDDFDKQNGANIFDSFHNPFPSFGKKKRPAPQPPNQDTKNTNEFLSKGKDSESTKPIRNPQNKDSSPSKLSSEEKERLIANIAKLKAHAERKSLLATPPSSPNKMDLGSKFIHEQVVCNDSLKLERGVLKPNKELPKIDTSETKLAPVSPRPWYKRNLVTKDNSGAIKKDLFKSLEKKKERKSDENWMPEVGIPRGGSGVLPSDGSSFGSSKFSFFSKSDKSEEKRKDVDKRKSQVSMLANISELDREAAEIVQREQAKEQALLAAEDAKFYSFSDVLPTNRLSTIDVDLDLPDSNNVDVTRRSSTKELISLFNAIGNVTKVTVNSKFFSKESSKLFSKETSEKRFSFLGESPKKSVKPGIDGEKSFQTDKMADKESVPVDSKPTLLETRKSSATPLVNDSSIVCSNRSNGSNALDVLNVTSHDSKKENAEQEKVSKPFTLFEANKHKQHYLPKGDFPPIVEQSESIGSTVTETKNILRKFSDMNTSDISNTQIIDVKKTPASETPLDTKKSAKLNSLAENKLPDPLIEAKRLTIWSCPRCTLENPRWKLMCDACSRWRPSLAEEKVDPLPIKDTSLQPTAPLASPDESVDAVENTLLQTKSSVNWEKEIKKYFPSKDVTLNGDSQDLLNPPIQHSNTNLETIEAVANKSDVSIPEKLNKENPVFPSTFIGGKLKQDEEKVKNIVKTNLTQEKSSTNPVKEPDVDEVRKARLAFFNKESHDSEVLNEIDPQMKKRDSKICNGHIVPEENEQQKLIEILKEMKNSLPKRSKQTIKSSPLLSPEKDMLGQNKGNNDIKDVKNSTEPQQSSKLGAIKKVPKQKKSEMHKNKVEVDGSNSESYKNKTEINSVMKETAGSRENEQKVSALLITEEVIINETKIKKCNGQKPAKVSTSVQTSAVIKKLEPSHSVNESSVSERKIPTGRPPHTSYLPVTVEEYSTTIRDGVLCTSLNKEKKIIGTGTFELIRPKDFANIEATKTGGESHLVHVYANMPSGVSDLNSQQISSSSILKDICNNDNKKILSTNANHETSVTKNCSLSNGEISQDSSSTDVNKGNHVSSSSTSQSSSCSSKSDDNSEVERLTAQLTLPKGLADFKADLQAAPPPQNMNTLAINRLLRRLEAAIAGGQHIQAAGLAKELARLKISCSVTRQHRSLDSSPASVTVDMYVEDKVSHQGPIPLRVIPTMTVAQLKEKVEQEFEIPVGVQRWILGKLLASDDTKTLQEHNVSTNGCPMFLYLVAPDGEKDDETGSGAAAAAVEVIDKIVETPRTVPEPPPDKPGGGWYYNNEEDRYSFCEDSASELSDENEQDTQNIVLMKNNIEMQKEEKVKQNEEEADDNVEEEEEEAEEEESESENEIVGATAVVHEPPIVLVGPPATSLVAKKAESNILQPVQKQVVPNTPKAESDTHSTVTKNETETKGRDLPKKKFNIVEEIVMEMDKRDRKKLPELTGTLKLGWKCPMCTLVNPPTRPGCAACTTERPLEYVVPPEYRANEQELQRIRQEQQLENELVEINKQEKIQKTEDQKKHYLELVDLENAELVLNVEAFDCPICMDAVGEGEGVVLRECIHSFCRLCLVNTIQYSEEAEVKCPYRDNNYACESVLQEREIKALVKKEVYEQHLAKSVAQAENKIENAFHCKTPDCRGWCIYEDNVNEFRCPVCRRINCLTCQAIHEGLNCKQYQEQMKQESETNADARRTREMLEEMVDRGEAMTCPTCQVVLMKKWGCDWLRCSMCKTEICWVTRGPRWGPGGKGDTTGGCQCGVNGVKCHPRCNYCH